VVVRVLLQARHHPFSKVLFLHLAPAQLLAQTDPAPLQLGRPHHHSNHPQYLVSQASSQGSRHQQAPHLWPVLLLLPRASSQSSSRQKHLGHLGQVEQQQGQQGLGAHSNRGHNRWGHKQGPLLYKVLVLVVHSLPARFLLNQQQGQAHLQLALPLHPLCKAPQVQAKHQQQGQEHSWRTLPAHLLD
jgi:hypothetical protein